MKQSWTRLSQMVLKLGGNTKFMYPRFRDLFMRHHRNACEIVMDRKGVPMAAVYFSPEAKHNEQLKSLMAEIRKRTLVE